MPKNRYFPQKPAMQELIEERLNAHIRENKLNLNDEQYRNAYKGIEFWLNLTLPEAVNDSTSNVL